MDQAARLNGVKHDERQAPQTWGIGDNPAAGNHMDTFGRGRHQAVVCSCGKCESPALARQRLLEHELHFVGERLGPLLDRGNKVRIG